LVENGKLPTTIADEIKEKIKPNAGCIEECNRRDPSGNRRHHLVSFDEKQEMLLSLAGIEDWP
jgi:hypothetical protein